VCVQSKLSLLVVAGQAQIKLPEDLQEILNQLPAQLRRDTYACFKDIGNSAYVGTLLHDAAHLCFTMRTCCSISCNYSNEQQTPCPRLSFVSVLGSLSDMSHKGPVRQSALRIIADVCCRGLQVNHLMIHGLQEPSSIWTAFTCILQRE
jgi:hypothetical protein